MKRALASIAAVCACVAAVPRLGAQVQSPPGYPAVGQPAIVTVIAAGAEPRRALRYTIANGRKDHMNMDMLMAMTMSMAGMDIPAMQMPTMHMGADMAVTTVTPAGDASYTIDFTDMGWIAAPGVDPQVLAMLQGMPIETKGLKATATVSSRGINRDMHLDLTKISNPQIAQMMSSVSSSMENLSMPLPEPAVGLGARWEARQAIEANGMRTFQKYEFELVSADDKGCSLKVKVEQMAPAQAMSNPALPPGTEASLEKLSGTGTGTMAIRWESLVPTSEMTLHSDMIMNVSVAGSSQQMTTAITMKMSVAAVK